MDPDLDPAAQIYADPDAKNPGTDLAVWICECCGNIRTVHGILRAVHPVVANKTRNKEMN
jgi:hypothetical protein